MENELATYIIDVAWEELFGEEDYDVDKLTDELNKELKRLRKELEE